MNAETAEKEKNPTEEKKEVENKEEVTTSETADDPQASENKAAKEKKVDPSPAAVSNLRLLENIEVKLTVEVGNTEIKIKDLLRLNEGSVIELDRLAGDALDILANGTKIAKGEVVMVGEKFGIRFTEVADPEELVQNL
jgi:flagellar motor switch protein FliN